MSKANRRDEIQGEIIHEYDGIEEADNDLPKWWLYIFYGSIAFAMGYWFYYHEYEVGPGSMEAYAAAVQESAGGGGEVSDEMLNTLAATAPIVEKGQQIFSMNCVACHKEKGEGNIGPNLTDEFWIHGGAPTNIHMVVAEGVPAKGMTAWASLLGPEGVKQVTAYVLTLRNTNVPGKAPEGEKWVPGAAGDETSANEDGDEVPAEGATDEAAPVADEANPAEAPASPVEGEAEANVTAE